MACWINLTDSNLRYQGFVIGVVDTYTYVVWLFKYHLPSFQQKSHCRLRKYNIKKALKHPNSMKCLKNNPSVIYPIFKFSSAVRKIIYTINAIGLLNSITLSLTAKK